MPDLVTHVAFTHIVGRLFPLKRTGLSLGACLTLLYLGTILPDILTRPLYILLPIPDYWFTPIHTPFGMLLITLIIAMLFHSAYRWRIFGLVYSGVLLHFLLDATQIKYYGNNFWFYPFSMKDYHWDLLWAEDYVNRIPAWILLVIVFEMALGFLKRKLRERPF